MTSLNFRQVHARDEPEFDGSRWIYMRTYQLEPWPDVCEITYYDIGEFGSVRIGQTVTFNWDNGRAEYEVARDINGLKCDFECKLLPGSTWTKPPPAASHP